MHDDLIAMRAPALILSAALAVLIACGRPGQDSLALAGPAAAKVDPELRRTAAQMLAEDRGDSLLAVLVRVAEDTDARAALEAAGMRVDTVVGDVITGAITPRTLAAAAALDPVIQMQLARKLEIK